MSRSDVPSSWLVDESKISAYLLNPHHPHGASKAKYLVGFGFSRLEPRRLADALMGHALGNGPGLIKVQVTGLDRIVFEGTVTAPDGRAMPLRTVWEIGEDGERRFLTAVPLTR